MRPSLFTINHPIQSFILLRVYLYSKRYSRVYHRIELNNTALHPSYSFPLIALVKSQCAWRWLRLPHTRSLRYRLLGVLPELLQYRRLCHVHVL